MKRHLRTSRNRNILGVMLVALSGILAMLFTKARIKLVYPLKIRRDAQGDGSFGTSRNPPYHIHYGIDLVVQEGQPVFAPFNGQVQRINKALKDKAGYTGVRIDTAGGLQVDVLYIVPVVTTGEVVSMGDLLGYAQDITKAYGSGMINHIHVEHYDSVKKQFMNPTPYYFAGSLTGLIAEAAIQVDDDFYQAYTPHPFDSY